MRVLVIAPDQPGLNTKPEIRQIQRRHHMSVLDGTVTAEDIYQACRETKFDVHHYATDSGHDGVLLSNGQIFTAEDIAQVARIHDTACLFFNSCNSSGIAAYSVRHGVRFAIHTNIPLLDNEAWKPALAFYESLQNGHGKDIVGAYIVADSGDGDYGLYVSPAYVQELQATAASAILPRPGAVLLEQWHIIIMTLGLLVASGALTLVINALAGR